MGAVLTLIGVAGFLTDSNLLIVFGINLLHSAVHVATGLLGLTAGFYAQGRFARQYNKWMGIIYLVLGVIGFIIINFLKSLLNINLADNVLHLLIGIVLVSIAFGSKE